MDAKSWLLKPSVDPLRLHLLAVLLAFLLWIQVASQETVQMNVVAPVEFLDMPTDLEISNDYPREVEVVLQSDRPRSIESEHISVMIDMRDAASGAAVVHLNANNVRAANTLLRYGARGYTYPGMSHIKASIIDGWACLGSANFDKLSFRVNKEMNVGISHTSFVNGLKAEVFEADMRHSIELLEPLPENWHNTVSAIGASQL